MPRDHHESVDKNIPQVKRSPFHQQSNMAHTSQNLGTAPDVNPPTPPSQTLLHHPAGGAANIGASPALYTTNATATRHAD